MSRSSSSRSLFNHGLGSSPNNKSRFAVHVFCVIMSLVVTDLLITQSLSTTTEKNKETLTMPSVVATSWTDKVEDSTRLMPSEAHDDDADHHQVETPATSTSANTVTTTTTTPSSSDSGSDATVSRFLTVDQIQMLKASGPPETTTEEVGTERPVRRIFAIKNGNIEDALRNPQRFNGQYVKELIHHEKYNVYTEKDLRV